MARALNLSDETLKILKEPYEGCKDIPKTILKGTESTKQLKEINDRTNKVITVECFRTKNFVWLMHEKDVFEHDIAGYGKARENAWDRLVTEFKKQSMNSIIETGNDIFDEKQFQADLKSFANEVEAKRSHYESEWNAAVAAHDIDAITVLNGKLNELIKFKSNRPKEEDPRYHSKEKVTVPISGKDAWDLIQEANQIYNEAIEKLKSEIKAEYIRVNSVKDIPESDWKVYKALAHAGMYMRDVIKNHSIVTDSINSDIINPIIDNAFLIADSSEDYNKKLEGKFESLYEDSKKSYIESMAFKEIFQKIYNLNLEYACGMFRCFARDFHQILRSECLIDETSKALENL